MTKGTVVLDPISKQYVKPTNPFIGRGDKTEALYQREEKRDEAFHAAAQSLGRVLGHTEKEFWTKTLPEALYAMLDHWDHHAGELACIAFLEKRGWIVTMPEKKD
jgi:hypothetical protein